MIYYYKGWEYEKGNHMFQSKRHIFRADSVFSLCGRANPYHIHARRDEGDGVCRRCEHIAAQLGIEAI